MNNTIQKKNILIIFILNHHYKLKNELFHSSLSSVFENLLSQANYGFPKFLTSFNNEFDFNSVIFDILKNMLIKVLTFITKKYPGYTFHELTIDEMNVIVDELYNIYISKYIILCKILPLNKKHIFKLFKSFIIINLSNILYHLKYYMIFYNMIYK